MGAMGRRVCVYVRVCVCVCVCVRQTATLFLNPGSFLGHRRHVADASRELNYAAL